MLKERKKRDTNLACFGLRPVLIKIEKEDFKLTNYKETHKLCSYSIAP